MKQKVLYQRPESSCECFQLLGVNLICSSYSGPQTSYTGAVNDFSDIDETDISDLWN